MIEKNIERIKKHFKDKRVFVFEEFRSHIVDSDYQIGDNYSDKISYFFDLVEKTESRVAFLNILRNDLEGIGTEDLVDEEDIRLYELLKKNIGQIMAFSIHILYEGKSIGFSQETDLYEDAADLYFNIVENNRNYNHLKNKPISFRDVEKYGQELAESDKFEKIKNRRLRILLANELFGEKLGATKENISNDIEMIVYQAEHYFENNISPNREKELKENIQRLKSEGLTKVKISSELGVSKDTVNKYY